MSKPMTTKEKKCLIALLRAEIRLYQVLEPIKQEIGSYYHSSDYSEQDLEECEKIAQDTELD